MMTAIAEYRLPLGMAFGSMLIGLASACSEPRVAVVPAPVPVVAPPPDPRPSTWSVGASVQRPGDPMRGRQALLNENYIGCGVPDAIVSQFANFSATPIEGRDELNRDLPFFLTRYTTPDGVKVVTANCLGCHGAFLRGDYVIGLGNIRTDFTIDPSGPLALLTASTSGPVRRELALLNSRVSALFPSVLMETVGPSPADHIAAVLFAHRDPTTLAWSDKPRMKLPDHKPTPVDVPAWWLMAKKNAMFYTAAGRGDHARIMMTASALCTDSVSQAEAIDAYFPDVRAYIASLEPPPYPEAVDSDAAQRGAHHFAARCQRCHGTYDSDPSVETYPNLVVALDVIGTDSVLAIGSGQFAVRFVDWFNRSFYGKIAKLDPQRGYIAPPLDGVWATAPYFHNGSVPTIAAVLDSSVRPARWRRTSRSSRNYDLDNLGWPHKALGARAEGQPWIYDTTRPGYGAGGHTFGDSFSAAQRADLIEYLKTL